MSALIRTHVSDDGEITEHGAGIVQDLFENMPVTNIRSEVHFASARMRSMSSHGMAPNPASLASDHVIAESRLILDSTINGRRRRVNFAIVPLLSF